MKCSECKKPGICCKQFILKDSIPWAYTAIETKAKVIKRLKDCNLSYFKPIRKGKRFWVFKCTKVKNGKCAIYDSRPNLCRKYRAGTGTLCVHSKRYSAKVTGD